MRGASKSTSMRSSIRSSGEAAVAVGESSSSSRGEMSQDDRLWQVLRSIPWDRVDIEVLSVELTMPGLVFPGSRAEVDFPIMPTFLSCQLSYHANFPIMPTFM